MAYEQLQSLQLPEPPIGYTDLLQEECAIMRPPIGPRLSPFPKEIYHSDTLNNKFSKEDAKELLILLAFDDSYPESLLRNLRVNDVSTSYNKLHYQLYLFCEVRIARWRIFPYRGGPIDDKGNGNVPPPWEVPVRADQEFLDHRKTVCIPHSDVVKICSACNGTGHEILGYETISVVKCMSCIGRGWNEDGKCPDCNGTGRKRKLKGSRCCWVCDGHKKIKWRIEMTVYFFTRTADFLTDNPSKPSAYVIQSPRATATPIESLGEDYIKTSSRQYAENHLMNYPYERVLQQRVRVSPVYEVQWTYNRKKGKMWIYGDHMKAEGSNLSVLR
ncbi:protein SSUH2 homolog [Ptychodera flava]|uniref:protein SSUH2 homolog n=1 Tax=Ptychodera flava TaxID=63121 RepID=UPI00396A93DD